jgi:hypothetical protein
MLWLRDLWALQPVLVNQTHWLSRILLAQVRQML